MLTTTTKHKVYTELRRGGDGGRGDGGVEGADVGGLDAGALLTGVAAGGVHRAGDGVAVVALPGAPEVAGDVADVLVVSDHLLGALAGVDAVGAGDGALDGGRDAAALAAAGDLEGAHGDDRVALGLRLPLERVQDHKPVQRLVEVHDRRAARVGASVGAVHGRHRVVTAVRGPRVRLCRRHVDIVPVVAPGGHDACEPTMLVVQDGEAKAVLVHVRVRGLVSGGGQGQRAVLDLEQMLE